MAASFKTRLLVFSTSFNALNRGNSSFDYKGTLERCSVSCLGLFGFLAPKDF
jgi:hypothetical protein